MLSASLYRCPYWHPVPPYTGAQRQPVLVPNARLYWCPVPAPTYAQFLPIPLPSVSLSWCPMPFLYWNQMQVHTGSQCHPKLVANANPVSAFSGAQCQPVLVAVAIPTLEPNASLNWCLMFFSSVTSVSLYWCPVLAPVDAQFCPYWYPTQALHRYPASAHAAAWGHPVPVPVPGAALGSGAPSPGMGWPEGGFSPGAS